MSLTFTTVEITDTDAHEIFSASVPTSFGFIPVYGDGSPLISANSDGSDGVYFGFDTIEDFVGTAYLKVPSTLLPFTLHVAAWNAS